MDSTQEGDSVVFVTLLEAAEEIDGSAEDLRKAVRQQQIKGVKENPENKRSRWLVALEDVRTLYQTEPSELSESPSGTVGRDEPPVVIDDTEPTAGTAVTETSEPEIQLVADDDTAPDDTGPTAGTVVTETSEPEIQSVADDDTGPTAGTVVTETSEPEIQSVADNWIDPNPAPMEAVPDVVINQLKHLPSNRQDSMPASTAVAIPGRGEELIERLTHAIDRFSESVPEAPFDYQALLDKYVVAVEERAEAEVRAATLQRRVDDLRDQMATTAERLEQVQTQNRQLLAEFEIARAEFDAALNRDPVDEARPLWKRRNRQ